MNVTAKRAHQGVSALPSVAAVELLLTVGNVCTDSGELVRDHVAKGWHCGNQGEAHGSGDQSILNCSCARLVFQKLLHVKTPIY
jgi:hypothetical protein